MKEKTPEDNGEIVTLFLKTAERLWDDLSPQLKSDFLPHISNTNPTQVELKILSFPKTAKKKAS